MMVIKLPNINYFHIHTSVYMYSHLGMLQNGGEKLGFRESTLRDTTWTEERVFGHCGAVLTPLWAITFANLLKRHADPTPRNAKTVTPRLLLVQSGRPSETHFRDFSRSHATWEWVFG